MSNTNLSFPFASFKIPANTTHYFRLGSINPDNYYSVLANILNGPDTGSSSIMTNQGQMRAGSAPGYMFNVANSSGTELECQIAVLEVSNDTSNAGSELEIQRID